MNSLVSTDQAGSSDLAFPAGASRLSTDDREALERAMRELERTSLAIRMSAILGRQAGAIASIVPKNIAEIANTAAESAIRSGLNFALRSLAGKPLRDRRRMHKSIAVLAGAAGGAFGIASLPVELPFSTTIMLRSIADIARAEGLDLADPKTALACLEVFALGGRDDSNRDIRFPTIDVPASNFSRRCYPGNRLFCATRHFGEVGIRSSKLSHGSRCRERGRAGACPLGGADKYPFRGCCLAKTRGPKRSADRGRGRSRD